VVQGVSMLIKQVAILKGYDPDEVDSSDSIGAGSSPDADLPIG